MSKADSSPVIWVIVVAVIFLVAGGVIGTTQMGLFKRAIVQPASVLDSQVLLRCQRVAAANPSLANTDFDEYPDCCDPCPTVASNPELDEDKDQFGEDCVGNVGHELGEFPYNGKYLDVLKYRKMFENSKYKDTKEINARASDSSLTPPYTPDFNLCSIAGQNAIP